MTMRRNQRGNAESVQWALLTPLVLLLIVGAVQTGIWLHGRGIAQEAAAAGAEAAAVTSGNPVAARGVVTRMAGDLRDVQVAVVADGSTVTVTVDARTQTFMDLGQGRVHASATHPRESR